MKNRKNYRSLRVLLLGVIAVCLLLLGWTYQKTLEQRSRQEELLRLKENAAKAREERERQAKLLESLQESAESQTEETESETVEESQPVMLEQYTELYEENNDLAGWLAIEGMVIDYPVMQCEDDEYYLHHDFDGKDSKYGCLYVKNKADLAKGTNFIIYGHNMKDGSMFGDLDLYRDKEFYQKHREISFDTLYEERTYEIVAVFLSQVYNEEENVFKYYKFYEAETQEEFDDFYENIKALSLYDTGVEAEFGDTFLTLSTCAYHVKDGRLAVVAKRKSAQL